MDKPIALKAGHGNCLSSSRIARDHSQYRMHALERIRIRAELANSTAVGT